MGNIMAIIFPSNINYEQVKLHSEAEYKILKLFDELPKETTKDWIIYYSCYFKGREKNSNSIKRIWDNNEIDFLILAPNLGIFVFEIKGGRIQVENGEIYTISRTNKKNLIDPYNQAKNNYYSLKEIIDDLKIKKVHNLDFGKFVYGTLVGFPDIDVIPNVGLKSNGIDTFVDGMNLYKFLLSNSELNKKRNPFYIVPTKEDVEDIINAINGIDLEYSLNTKNYINSVNLRINQLTEEQNTIFRGLLSNDRCLIKGGAGTGKTVLCEFLYKYLTEEKKQSVIYFTFNKLISRKLNKDLNQSDYCKCFPIIEFLKDEYKRENGKEFDFGSKFNAETINTLFKEVASYFLSFGENIKKYDCLIIDEAQDIEFSEEVLLFFDLILNKGLKDGKCYLFFDDNQNIFTGENKKIYNSSVFEEYRYSKFELLKNCRNSEGVKSAINSISKIENKTDDLTYVKEQLVNSNVQFKEINSNQLGVLEIKECIQNLIKERIDRNQITLLFNKKPNDKNYIFQELKRIYGDYLQPYESSNSKSLTYSTVAAFKGLENDIIIYVNDNKYSRLREHYVSISRAKVFAYIFKVN